MNLLHVCMIHLSRKPATVQSFLRDNKSHYLHVPSLLVVKRVASTFVEVSLCFGFCVFWLTPIPLSVLCVSTCSDGLLDFHMKDELRTDSDPAAWRIWSTSQNQLWQLRQPAPLLEFPGEQGMLTNMYAQVREEEQVISLQFICSQQDVSKSRRKKRKQVDDGTTIV